MSTLQERAFAVLKEEQERERRLQEQRDEERRRYLAEGMVSYLRGLGVEGVINQEITLSPERAVAVVDGLRFVFEAASNGCRFYLNQMCPICELSWWESGHIAGLMDLARVLQDEPRMRAAHRQQMECRGLER